MTEDLSQDYEIIPMQEVQKLKEEIEQLKQDKEHAPSALMSSSLEHLATNLEKLFALFEVAATDIEHQKKEEKSFEEKIKPLVNKLDEIAQQNKDMADAILALADKMKGTPSPQPAPVSPPTGPAPLPPLEPPKVAPPSPSMQAPPSNLPPPPPLPPETKPKKGLFGR